MDIEQARALAAEVLASIAPEANLADIGPDEDLRRAIDLDSMDFMNLVVGLSRRTGVNVPEAEAARLHTLGGIAGYFTQARAA